MFEILKAISPLRKKSSTEINDTLDSARQNTRLWTLSATTTTYIV